MAEGTTLGKAWVQIVPSAKGISGSISGLLSGEAASAGTSAGNTVGSSMVSAIKGVIAAAGIGAAVKSSITAGMNFDSEMAHVSAISGATGEAFDALRAKALELGSSTKFSATESAQAFGYMAMAGWDVGQMMDGVDGILSLAAADGLDLASTSDIVTDALTGFNLSAADAGHFADVLATASSSANTNVSMMGETFKYAASVVGSLYGEEGRAEKGMEDSALAIGLMANAGIKSTQAGTAFRSILTRIATDAGASSKSLGALGILTEKLGVEFYDESGRARDFSAVLDECRAAWSGLSAEEQSSYAKKIAGQEAMTGWLAMMNASGESVNSLAEAIANADGAAERMSGIMQNTLAGSITSFWSAVEGLQIAAYDRFSGSLTRIVDLARESISTITTAVTTGDLTPLMEFGGELLQKILTGILEGLPVLAEAAVNLMSSLGGYLRDNLPMLLQSGLEMAVQLSGSIRENAGKLIDGGLELLKNLAKGFADSIPTLLENIPTIISNIAGIINDNAPKIIEAGVYIIITLAKGVIASIPTLIAEFPKILKAILDVFTAFNWLSLGSNAVTFIKNGVQSLKNALPDAFRSIGNSAKSFFQNIDWKSAGTSAVNLVKGGVSSLFHAIPDALRSIASAAKDKFLSIDWLQIGKDILNGIWRGITSMADGFLANVGGFVGKILEKFTGKEGFDEHSPSKWAETVFQRVLEGGEIGFTKGIPDILASAENAVSRIQDTVSSASVAGPSAAWKEMIAPAPPSAEGRSWSLAERETRTDSPTSAQVPTIVVNCILDGQKVGTAVAAYQRNQQRAYGY